MKLKIVDSFDGNQEFIAEGETLTKALENALNQLGYTSYYLNEKEG